MPLNVTRLIVPTPATLTARGQQSFALGKLRISQLIVADHAAKSTKFGVDKRLVFGLAAVPLAATVIHGVARTRAARETFSSHPLENCFKTAVNHFSHAKPICHRN